MTQRAVHRFSTTIDVAPLVRGGYRARIDHMISTDEDPLLGCSVCRGEGLTVEEAIDAANRDFEARHPGVDLIARVRIHQVSSAPQGT